MTLAELLSIPFIRGALSVSGDSGAWCRRFEYPEIPGCYVEAQTALDGMRALELTRVAQLLHMVAAGQHPPTPRAPLRSLDVAAQLRDFGLTVPGDLLLMDHARADGDPRVTALAEQAANLAREVLEEASGDRNPIAM
jgi:hypothetical protein